MSASDTIFALATPPGKSGVAVVRISGAGALYALKQLCRKDTIAPRHAYFTALYAPETNTLIDRGLALYFAAPHSFTGEEVVELHLHGSLAVIREILHILSAMPGLRPADPGEFTRRAFLNGKMDLLEAEGLADLIDAQTSEQKKQALRVMGGEASRLYEDIRLAMIRILALLEAYIDFPDEEIPESVLKELQESITALQTRIETTLQDERRFERVREGIHIVILGAPNAGKSSLLNALAKRDAAIVSERAGTTRDVIEVHLDICGYPVVLVDTAGIRESEEMIEAEGIRRALARAEAADIKIVLFDGTQLPQLDAQSLSMVDNTSIVAITKIDALHGAAPHLPELPAALTLSTFTGQGMEALIAAMEKRIIDTFSGQSAPFIIRQRHRGLLMDALYHLDKSKHINTLELQCEELRLAAQAIGKITGNIQADEVLDVIFRSFCIGK